jgi:anti-sigma-K factor RskA
VVLVGGLLAWNIDLRSGASPSRQSFAIALHGAGGASGWMFYDDANEIGVITVERLAALPPGQTYQVWVLTPDGPQSCGLLAVADQSPAFARMTADVSSSQTFFVTIEPAGGSTRPTGVTVMSSKR